MEIQEAYPGEFIAVGCKKGRSLANGIDVSSRAQKPYSLFSPFSYSHNFHIPVPGTEGIYANSVESIWQGLKIINGVVDFSLFKKRPEKRKGDVQGHLFGSQSLGIVDARRNIYQPAYLFHFQHHIPEKIKEEVLLKALKEGVAFYDVEENVKINNSNSRLAHSAFLAEFLREYMGERLVDEKEKIDNDYLRENSPHETLAEPLARAAERIKKSCDIERELTIFILKGEDPSLNEYHQRFYSRLLELLSS